MLRPKHSLAMLVMRTYVLGRSLSLLLVAEDGLRGEGAEDEEVVGKLLRTLPSVLSPKVRKPAKAMVRHASMDMAVE